MVEANAQRDYHLVNGRASVPGQLARYQSALHTVTLSSGVSGVSGKKKKKWFSISTVNSSQLFGHLPRADLCCAGQPGHVADRLCSVGGNGAGV